MLKNKSYRNQTTEKKEYRSEWIQSTYPHLVDTHTKIDNNVENEKGKWNRTRRMRGAGISYWYVLVGHWQPWYCAVRLPIQEEA